MSFAVDYECTLLTEIYTAECLEEYLPYTLADPDFPEQDGPKEMEGVFYNPPVHKAP
ncbi:MAG: hypothetical protein JWR61_3465 [Ferruginibacter sp.]|jgi:hypothetical protein|uniref:hypothetical protein n=1 Tax=Ferruginibacter sp. TaxID=1940288 RepID=UPI00265A0882|nr:hypothetical protein [Ferruginibacter sp.]MDB5278510.1 hypothetical protein [Ferruginibacter sp.]